MLICLVPPQSLHQLLGGDAPSCGHCIFTFITLNKGNGDRVRKNTKGHYVGFRGRGICFVLSVDAHNIYQLINFTGQFLLKMFLVLK